MHPTSFYKSLCLVSRNAESCNLHRGEDDVDSMQPLRRVTSVADILDSKRVDPEVILSSIGFVQHDMSLLQRLPHRFFVSQRDQVLTKQFLSMHPEFQESEEHEALSAVAEIFTRIPPSFHDINPSEPCTQLHKIIASHSPLARQRLMRQSAVFASTDIMHVTPRTPVRGDSVSSKKRHRSKGPSSLTTIGEIGSFAAKPPSSASGGSLSSCDVTDESSDGEHSPLVLKNRQPILHLFNQNHVINILARHSTCKSQSSGDEDSDMNRSPKPNSIFYPGGTFSQLVTQAVCSSSKDGKDTDIGDQNSPRHNVRFSEQESSPESTASPTEGIYFTHSDKQNGKYTADQNLCASQTFTASQGLKTEQNKVLRRQSTVHNPAESNIDLSSAEITRKGDRDNEDPKVSINSKPSVKPIHTYTIRKRICGTSRMGDIDAEGHK
ncbi:uncharacterized protein [Watersipora subatra]|uniref:uncharacterized protein n=1 Tax=Watersipora subatra TaxID=2589382 RepID=UPI00355B68F2